MDLHMILTDLDAFFVRFDGFSTDDAGKLKTFRTGSVTHGSELSFTEFLDLFKSFR
jgi:hypothetical protein